MVRVIGPTKPIQIFFQTELIDFEKNLENLVASLSITTERTSLRDVRRQIDVPVRKYAFVLLHYYLDILDNDLETVGFSQKEPIYFGAVAAIDFQPALFVVSCRDGLRW